MKKQIATLLLGAALAVGSVQAQDTEKVPELTQAEKTTIQLLQAQLQNAQLSVQLLLARAQASQVQSQAKQAELNMEILRLRGVKDAPSDEFDFALATLTFSKKVIKKDE